MKTNQKPRRIKILGVHRYDACYKTKEMYIGKIGTFTPDMTQSISGYFSGYMDYDSKEYLCNYFYGVRYRRI